MISPTSPATTTRKTTPPTVMESPPRVILARRPGRGQHEYGQAGDAGADRGACPVEVVADGWHVVPALHLHAGGGEDALRRPVQAHEEDGRLAHFTKTHVGFSSGNAITPMSAVTAIRTGLLTLQRNRTPRLASPTSAVSQSPIAIRPSSTQAPR